MTVKDILAMTGEDFNTMDRKELVEVDRVLAGAARKRLKSLTKGFAYERLLKRANNTVHTGTQQTLFVSKGQIKIATPKTASIQDLRALRKELFSYLKDPTSTKSGYNKIHVRMFKQILARFHDDVEEYYKSLPEDEVERWEEITRSLEKISNNSDLLDYGKIHLGWSSGNGAIKEAIEHCGGYQAMYSGDVGFTIKLKAYIEKETKKMLKQAKRNKKKNNLTSHEENKNNLVAIAKDKYGINI